MTATQLARKHEINASTCMSVLGELERTGLLECLNPHATKSRIYWFKDKGKRMQSRLRAEADFPPLEHSFPDIDWFKYGYVCFSHRAAIVCVLTRPLQAAAIKRLARKRWPGIPMSANNVRDALRLLLRERIVQRVMIPKKKHPRYVLADECMAFPTLLQQANWGSRAT